MPEWLYDPEHRLVYTTEPPPDARDPASLSFVVVAIAEDVSPEDGPVIALVPKMEALLRRIDEVFSSTEWHRDGCCCFGCRAHAIAVAIDRARDPTGESRP